MKKNDEDRNPIVNTREQPLELHLLCALGDSMHGKPSGSFIEDMEERGQRQLVSQTTRLPTDGLTTDRHGASLGGQLKQDGKEENPWEKMGVKIGEPVVGDEMFTNVELPAGWALKATSHSMWSKLVDDKGRERASMFYKAAFYDRSAFVRLQSRFHVGIQYKEDYEDRRKRSFVLDHATKVGGEDPALYGYEDTPGTVLLVQEWTEDPDGGREACVVWLNERYPQWQDPSAHWDD